MVGMCARICSCLSMLHVFGKMQTTEFYFKEFTTKITSFEQHGHRLPLWLLLSLTH